MREQRLAWTSLLEHIVLPLEEACGSTVDVVATECTALHGCAAAEAGLRSIFGNTTRLLAMQTHCHSESQGDSMRATLNLFKDRAARRVASYGMIFVTRHDQVWTRNITQWHAVDAPIDYSRLNFLARCMMRCGDVPSLDVSTDRTQCHFLLGGPPSQCVLDSLHVMPGKLFRAFDEHIVGTAGCFSAVETFGRPLSAIGSAQQQADPRRPFTPSTAGHLCYNVSASVLPEPPGFVSSWRPRHFAREPSPISRYVRLHS